jgi:TolB protein
VNRSFPIRVLTALVLAVAARAGAQPATSAPTPGTGPVAPPVSSLPSQVVVDILGAKGARIPIAIPVTIAPLQPELQKGAVDPFFTTLSDDLSGSRVFVVSDPTLYPKGLRPPTTREQGDQWKASSAQYLLDTHLAQEPAGPGCQAPPCVSVEAQLYDLGTLKPILSKKYTGESRAARKIAHTLANDLTRQFTGKPGPFLTKIAFVSDRDEPRVKEIYTMDFDGDGQRRITYSHTLSLAPDWSPDGRRIAYQSYEKDTPGVFLVGRDGSDKVRIPLATQLNASPSFSPDGRTIAFCGSVKGNPEIFTVQMDGSGLKRLTENVAIDSTPRWSPNGRELAFTSNRQGTPQIYMMDLEGANVRRVSLAGNWNDEAAFSPDGGRIGFACRNEGDFQICIMDLQTGRTLQISEGPGAHENPTWSPDGSKVAWEVTRGNSTQIAVANADGSNMRIVTSAGNNFSPAWIKTLE